MRENPPEAQYLGHTHRTVRVICPYCKNTHIHKYLEPGRQHFAPHCGLVRSANQRMTGYTFEIPQITTERPRP